MAMKKREPEQKPDRIPQRKQTAERPRCDCENQAEIDSGAAVIYTASGLAQLGANWSSRRIRVEVSSKVQCDPDTQQCLYEYAATASVQRLQANRWNRDQGRKAYVKSFTVHDSVRETSTAEREDRPQLTVVTWNPKSPLKESTAVTLVLAPSGQTGHRITISERSVTICVPTGPTAQCP